MKRSNIIFISLISFLFIFPFILLGIYTLLPANLAEKSTDKQEKVSIIENQPVSEEYVYTPHLTEKLDAFINYYASMQKQLAVTEILK